jgi:hypothetical protein
MNSHDAADSGSAAIRPRSIRSVYAPPMASAELSRRVQKVVAYPPLCEMSEHQRREFHAADTFEGLHGRWQAAILEAEESRPKLRAVTAD